MLMTSGRLKLCQVLFFGTVRTYPFRECQELIKTPEYERLGSLISLSFKNRTCPCGILLTQVSLEIVSVDHFYHSAT